MRTFFACCCTAALLLQTGYARAAETLAHAQLSFVFGNGVAAPLNISAGLSQTGLLEKEAPPTYLPLMQLTHTLGGETSPSLLGKSLNAAEDGSGPSWLWWGVGAIAAVVVVAVATSGSNSGQDNTGGSPSVCGDNDVVIGDRCVSGAR